MLMVKVDIKTLRDIAIKEGLMEEAGFDQHLQGDQSKEAETRTGNKTSLSRVNSPVSKVGM